MFYYCGGIYEKVESCAKQRVGSNLKKPRKYEKWTSLHFAFSY